MAVIQDDKPVQGLGTLEVGGELGDGDDGGGYGLFFFQRSHKTVRMIQIKKNNMSRGLWVWSLFGFEAPSMYLQKQWGGFDITLAGARMKQLIIW